MSEEIIKVLDDLAKRFGIVVDWTQDNVLPYVQQLCEKLVKYEIATSTAWIIITAIGLAIGMASILLACTIFECDDFGGFLFIVGVVLIIIAITVIPTQIFDIIEARVLPEKTIFDWYKYNLR